MLCLNHVTVCYDQQTVIRDLSFDFATERIYGIIGKSGSGKSTLFNAIAGINPHQGEIMLACRRRNVKEQRIALVPQKNSLVKWQTLRQNITMPLKIRKIYDRQLLENLCDELHICHLLDKYPNHVSGGEQQRAAIARALLFQPQLLLLDEAFSALDAITRKEAHQLFLETIRRHRVTTIFITHDIDEALYLAESILLLADGVIVEQLDNPLFGLQKEDYPDLYISKHQELKAKI